MRINMSSLSKFKANLKHYPDPEIGDTIKFGTGRAIWTIIGIRDNPRLGHKGWTLLHLENADKTRHTNCYLKDAKFGW